MSIITRYSILDSDGKVIPSVEVMHLGDCYCADNLETGDEVIANTLSEAEAVASAMRNRNQSHRNKTNV